jgi:hypothetical protein
MIPPTTAGTNILFQASDSKYPHTVHLASTQCIEAEEQHWHVLCWQMSIVTEAQQCYAVHGGRGATLASIMSSVSGL